MICIPYSVRINVAGVRFCLLQGNIKAVDDLTYTYTIQFNKMQLICQK